MNMLDKLQPSASMEITRRAAEMRAGGRKVITMSIGDTHFPPPAGVQLALHKAVNESRTHYTAAKGIPELREAISDYYSGQYTAEEVLLSPGVKAGMYYYLMAHPAQRIAVLEPAWLGYEALCILTGKTYVPINAKRADWLESLSTTEFDLLICCLPNNPDGRIFSESEFQKLLEICHSEGAELAVDEIYRLYNYSGEPHPVEAHYGAEGLTVFNGFSKSHAVTGLRLGFVLCRDRNMMSDMLKLQQNISTCSSSLAQYALMSFEDSLDEVRSNSDYYHSNLQLALEFWPLLRENPPSGGFYCFPDLSPIGVTNASVFCRKLLESEGVALVPGAAYGAEFDSFVRMSFSIDQTELQEGLKRISNFIHAGNYN